MSFTACIWPCWQVFMFCLNSLGNWGDVVVQDRSSSPCCSFTPFSGFRVYGIVCLCSVVLMCSSPLLLFPVHFPGKCMSHTNSTYTFTTCRILHPSDELTRVTPRWALHCLSVTTGGSTMLSLTFKSGEPLKQEFNRWWLSLIQEVSVY